MRCMIKCENYVVPENDCEHKWCLMQGPYIYKDKYKNQWSIINYECNKCKAIKHVRIPWIETEKGEKK